MEGAREAEAWFCSDDSRWLFSFLPICNALGLEPQFHTDEAEALEPIPPGVCSGKVVN